MNFKRFFLIGVLLILPLLGYAQRYNLQVYSVNKGLPHSQVHSLLQTSDGFLWAGTYGGGLAKFDGEEFTTYTINDGLKDNSIEVIYEDSKENLWVSTYRSGIAKMEGDQFVYPFNNSILDTSEVYAVQEMSNGELWIGTYQGGIFIYDGSQLRRLTTGDGLKDNTVWDFWEAENGNIWIATNEGLSVIEKNDLVEGTEFKNFTVDDGLSGESIYRIVPHPDGDLWFASSNGITTWDGSSFSAITEIGGVELDYVYDLIADSDGNMWIGTYADGVFVQSDSTSRHITQENGLSSNHIYALYEGHDGNIWIATDGAGINRYGGEGFTFYGSESGLSTPKIYSLFEDSKGTVWTGTSNGIFSFDGETFNELPFPEKYESSKEVWDIAELPTGELLFLMPDNAIYRYDGQELTNYSEGENLDLWFTYDLYVDRDSTLWISTDEGLIHQEEEETNHYDRIDGLASDIVYQVYKHKGYLWIATYNGISRFDGSDFKNFTTSDGIAHREITFITSDQKGNLWLGTAGGITLMELDENGDVTAIENFGKETGMELVTTQYLWFDEFGMLWQGTNGGIHRLDVPGYWETGDMSLMHYQLSDQGIGIETNQGAILPLGDNRALFGTMEGVLEVEPHKIDPSSENIDLYISKVERNSQEVDWQQYTDSLTYKFGRPSFPNVTFPYGQHTYSLSYTAPVFGNASNKLYRYKLEGFDESWSEPTSSETAIFTNLDPGDYNFIVQVKNGDSEWIDNEAQFEFAVAYPFWQTYWFYGLVGVSLIGLMYGYIKFRVGMLEKQRLQEQVDEQTKDLQEALAEKEVLIKEIHHRVKNNLAVISGLLELQMGYADNSFVSRVLSESQRRVQSISMIHEKLYQNEKLAEIDFEKYVHELIDIVAYSFSSPDKDINIDIDIDDFKLGVDQGIPCGLILNEVVSNAFEHAFKGRKEGTIKIRMNEIGKKVRLIIKDDGKGLPENFEDTERDSLGITLVETLSQQLKGEYEMTSNGDGQGTRFSLEFEKEEAPLKVPD